MRRKSRVLLLLLCAALLLPLLAAVTAGEARAAGEVTDTLTIKVGYYGLAEEDFVEVATYYWWELEELLPMHESSYSFYQDSNSAWGRDGDYGVTVVAAWGLYVDELLSYANIDLNSIQSVEFYTKDRDTGYRSYFTASDLFADRYYFESLNLHLKFLTDEDGKLLFDSYNKMRLDESEAWQYAAPVRAMLALESSWESYSSLNAYESFPYQIRPNTANMSASSRFRLLFGQTSPGEAGTQNRSAKYVHTLYVTLKGTAIYGSGVPELDGTIGSHFFDVDMIVENGDLMASIEKMIGFASSNSEILNITGWELLRSEFSDFVTVRVYYDVLREGEATVTALGAAANTVSGYGGGAVSRTVATGDSGAGEETPGDGGAVGGAQESDAPAEEKDPIVLPAEQTAEARVTFRLDLPSRDAQEEAVEAAPASEERELLRRSVIYSVPREILGLPETAVVTVPQAAEEITAPVIPESDREQRYLRYTLLGAAGLMLLGALSAAIDHKLKRRYRL